MTPKVSVITCVRNGGRFLAATIESILGQTFGDFEYWLVDDASTDDSRDVIERHLRDGRVRLLDTPERIGTYAAANLALARARGEYVARTDADDLSLPHRLAAQVAFLDAHPAVGLLGSAYTFIDEAGVPAARHETAPSRCEEIRWTLLFRNCIAHSTVMYRRALAQALGGYPAGRWGRDYDLWLRMAFTTEVAQLPDVCLRYRITRDGITAKHPVERRAVWIELRQRQAADLLGLSPDDPAVLEFARCCDLGGRAPRELDLAWFDWDRRFALRLVEPFCRRFGYGDDVRARITRLALEEPFWLVRWNEGYAPGWALAVHLRFVLRHRQWKSAARLLPCAGKWALGPRGLRVAKTLRARLGRSARRPVAAAKGTA